ncbi:TPA: hypothetical protein VAP34_002030 [Streptococcus agalactiae]|nr:hypothetical protein [Streptococcus agalactiae]
MTRRVIQWSKTNLDREELLIITVFEEGINKQGAKAVIPFSKRHGVLYKTEGEKRYEYK